MGGDCVQVGQPGNLGKPGAPEGAPHTAAIRQRLRFQKFEKQVTKPDRQVAATGED
jgi:hypothetical protein